MASSARAVWVDAEFAMGVSDAGLAALGWPLLLFCWWIIVCDLSRDIEPMGLELDVAGT